MKRNTLEYEIMNPIILNSSRLTNSNINFPIWKIFFVFLFMLIFTRNELSYVRRNVFNRCKEINCIFLTGKYDFSLFIIFTF